MSARLRKKKLYQQANNIFSPYGLTSGLTKKKFLKALRAIEPDLIRAFGNDRFNAWAWFINPVIALDGHRPVDLVVNGRLQVVREHLIRLEYCVYT